MLNAKENAFVQYVVQGLEQVEEGLVLTLPKPCDEYHIVVGANKTAIFVKGQSVTNPLDWIKSVCSEFGMSLPGFPKIQTIVESGLVLNGHDIDDIGVYSEQELEKVIEFLSKFSAVEPKITTYDNGPIDIAFETDFSIPINKDGKVERIQYVVYGLILEKEEEWEDEEWEDEDCDGCEDCDCHEDGIEPEDLIVNSPKIEVEIDGKSFGQVHNLTIEPSEMTSHSMKFGDVHKDIAHEVASLVSDKQKAYGNSVDKVQRVIEIMMEQYDNGDGTYTIPKELIPHLLYQVRIMDKQNRIFTNPEADLMDESPYTDILGYALLMLAKLKEEN